MGEKFAVSTCKEQEHMADRLEFPGLARLVVGLLLFSLGCFHVLPNNGCYPLNPFLHLLDVVSEGAEGGWVFLPGFLDGLQ